MSAPAFNALFDCATATTPRTCTISSPLATSCFLTNLAIEGESTTVDSAQARLANDFCKACDPTNAQCATKFYAATPIADGGATGTPLAIAGDTTAQDIDSKCVPPLLADAGTAACEAAFHACADPILAAGVYLPTECASGGAAPVGSNDGG